MRYRFGGLTFRGAYTWRAYFRNFSVGYAKFGVGAGGGGVIYAFNLGNLWLQDPLVGFLKSQSISIFTCMVPSCVWDLIK